MSTDEAVHPKHADFLSTLSQLTQPDADTRKSVILSKTKRIEKRLEKERLERRAKFLLAKEKQEARDCDHIAPTMTPNEYQESVSCKESQRAKVQLGWSAASEKQLRRAGTRGVCKLFNALKAQRDAAKLVVPASNAKKSAVLAHATMNSDTKAAVAQSSKQAFLNFLQRKPVETPAVDESTKWLAGGGNDQDAQLEDWEGQ